MASPYNDMLIAVLVGLGALVALLGAVLYWRNRQLQELRQVGERVAVAARDGDLDIRFGPDATGEDATELALNVDRMMERLQREHATRSDREAVLKRLVESMNESIAVEREGILVANSRFAELCGASSPAQLVGRRLPIWSIRISRSFSASICDATAKASRRRCGSRSSCGRWPGTQRGSSSTFARVSYDAQPALLISAVEISSRADQAHGAHVRATAWSALDSLSEGVLTTDRRRPHRVRQSRRRGAARQADGGCDRSYARRGH